MAMADLPPNLPAHVDHASKAPLGMMMMIPPSSSSSSSSPSPSSPSLQHSWPPAADQRDAYIAWLRAEFAAANAIIDSMCHHLRIIGGPGEYEPVFNSLQRRRHAWTPSLYMQQFFSVAEIVNSLQHIAWNRQQHPPVMAAAAALTAIGTAPSVGQFTCPPLQFVEENKKSFEKKTQRSTAVPPAILPVEKSLCKEQSTCSEKIVEGNRKLVTEAFEEAESEKAQDITMPQTHQDLNGGSSNETTLATCETEKVRPDEVEPTSTSVEEINGKKSNSEAIEEAPPHSLESHTLACANGTLSDEISHNQSSSSKNSGSITKELLSKDMSIALDEEKERLASIKRSMQFQCSEHEDGQMVNNGESAELCENVFNSTEIDNLVELIHQLQDAGKKGELGCTYSKKSNSAPDILQFGHKQRNVSEKNDIQPIPKFMHAVINWLTHCGILLGNQKPDSCVISIFDEGDFEAPNTDQCAWEKPICILSLMGECNMIFGHSISSDEQGSCKGPFQVAVPAGSILLLQEHFAGLLQKAIPASASRRITVALGKSCANISSKGRNKWTTGGGTNVYNGNGPNKQAMMAPMTPLHPSPHMHEHRHLQPPLPNPNTIFPNPAGGLMNPYMAHPGMTQGWLGLPRAPRVPNPGTGVFFPSNDPHAMPSWRSGLIVVSSFSPKNGSLVEVRRSSHNAKRGEKHGNHQFSANQARIKVSLDLIATKKRSNKHLTVATPCQDIQGTEDGKSQPIRASGIQT